MESLRVRLRATGPMAEELARSSLRLPGLIILELFTRVHLKNDDFVKKQGQQFQVKFHDEFQTWLEYLELPQFIKSRNFDVVLENVLNFSVLLLGTTFVFLPTNKLISLYSHIVSVLLLGAGYYLSYRYVQAEQESQDEVILDDFVKLERHGFHFLSQVMLAVVVSCLLSIRNDFARASLTVCAVPIVARLCGFPVEKLHVAHNFACCFLMLMACFYVLNGVPNVLSFLRRVELKIKDLIITRGYWRATMAVWRWAKLPLLFAVFWCVLCLTELYSMRKTNSSIPFYAQALYSMANSCATPLSLFGFCSATFYFSYCTIVATKLFLKGSFDATNVVGGGGVAVVDADIAHGGFAEGATLLLLALQTDLVNRNAEHKAFLICILLFIIFSSLLQSVYDIAEPALMQIVASQSGDVLRHVRALVVCALLFVVPIVMSIFIAALLPIDVWLMMIISSCVLISVQTLGSTIIYLLFIYDARRCHGTWDRLDDIIFYCRSAIRVMEFLVAFSVITYGVYESIFGEWSWTNSSILIVHCYFNVWQRLQMGWKSFLLRREAAKNLEMLPVADPKQLQTLQDVCSICYQEMHEARTTPCNHFFHAACLKKWLYVQQSCPMCHWDLSFKTRKEATTSENNQGNLNVDDDEEGYSSEDQSTPGTDFDTVTELSDPNED